MTRLNDYLRAERPDETEPASFYIPGAHEWPSRRGPGRPRGFEPLEASEEVVDELPLDTTDTQDIDELAAVQRAEALKKLDS